MYEREKYGSVMIKKRGDKDVRVNYILHVYLECVNLYF